MRRIIYMSPAEARFVILMGGKVLTSKRFKHRKNGFPVTIVLSLGKYLKSENFKREVRYGRFTTDFANDIDRIIEIDSRRWHDVVADYDRDLYIKDYCPEARILRVTTDDLKRNPKKVKAAVVKFISR